MRFCGYIVVVRLSKHFRVVSLPLSCLSYATNKSKKLQCSSQCGSQHCSLCQANVRCSPTGLVRGRCDIRQDIAACLLHDFPQLQFLMLALRMSTLRAWLTTCLNQVNTEMRVWTSSELSRPSRVRDTSIVSLVVCPKSWGRLAGFVVVWGRRMRQARAILKYERARATGMGLRAMCLHSSVVRLFFNALRLFVLRFIASDAACVERHV